MHTERPVVRVAGHGAEQIAATARDQTDVPVVEVGSTGSPAIEPLLIVMNEGRAVFYTNATTRDARTIAVALGDASNSLSDGDASVTHADSTRFPVPDLDGFRDDRSVLARCGWVDPTVPESYAETVGFSDASPESVLDAAGDTLGRGWGDWSADEPVGPLWEGVRDRDGDPAIVLNAHGNPGDVLLAESDPFSVLEGAAHVARVVDAARVFVYVSEDDETARQTLETAVSAYPDFPTDIAVVPGPTAYRSAEPTMAIEAVEGNHRLEARLRPPGPDVEGVFGEPTVVHTARTFAHVAAAVRGDESATRVITVAGDADEMTFEVPETSSIGDAVTAAGVTEYTGVLVGGRFGGLTRDLDVTPDPDALAERDLGTDGVLEVVGPDRCPVAFVGKRTQFAADANCGRCVPCREGSTQLSELLRDIYDGDLDHAKIEELLRVMESTSICTFGQHAPRPVRTGLSEFGDVFEAHANGECPAGQCSTTTETETKPKRAKP
ncbi:NADH-ubiquinone oxidoreductase-F iron-sulfur binding region domain-containing protein [Haladaptatus sp. DYF46]|uniref:NADH-ubiquinone oxidoreductase-F iron-sulfur binding region domain-containing protein n=1 Tax=Haladaptatus sp. DYF46 TaxID=2886041 RepID=UPI001E57ABCC|nr:NADH-ubiquinone oxidoreductase-F iron-sulfur binding region domain-containing protein [Haladaptatus sp. DYF46]